MVSQFDNIEQQKSEIQLPCRLIIHEDPKPKCKMIHFDAIIHLVSEIIRYWFSFVSNFVSIQQKRQFLKHVYPISSKDV